MQSGQYYFLNIYTTVYSGAQTITTYHLDLVPQKNAMAYLREKK